MGTRGIYGFRKNGQDKITYNHYDSYPEELGENIINFCRETSIQEMMEIFDRIVLVDNEKKPTKKQIKECQKKRWTHVDITYETEAHINCIDWYTLLRETQGNLNFYKRGLSYMIDDHNFIKDSLFCEYGYIINLDENCLEFWMGFQNKPQKGNRYGTKKYSEYDTPYYPCKLMKKFSLTRLSENTLDKMISIKEEEQKDDSENAENTTPANPKVRVTRTLKIKETSKKSEFFGVQ